MSIKIMIDPGHAGDYFNASPVVSGYYESNMTWNLSRKLKTALESYGFEVGMTRYNKYDDPELTERGRRAKGYDLFLSIHSNAAASSFPDAPWIISLNNDNKTNIDEISFEIGEELGYAISETMSVSAPYFYTKSVDFDRDGNGYLDDEYYGVLFGAKSVNVPAIILEHSFHTNEYATRWLMNDNNLTRLAEIEAKTLAKHYNMEDMPMTADERTAFNNLNEKVEKLENIISKYERQKVYDNAAIRWAYIDGNLPEYATPTIKKLVHKGYLNGGDNNSFELSEVMIRILVILDRAKVFD